MPRMKIGIVLPTFNVEATLNAALREVSQLLAEGMGELLIVDNNSSDRTRQVIADFFGNGDVAKGRCTVRLHQQNLGYGASIKGGFEFFRTRDVTHVLVLHSDAQTDNYTLATSLMTVAGETGADAVIGSRFTSGSDTSGYSVLRKLANFFFNGLTKVSAGRSLSDAGSAMVLLRKELLETLHFTGLPNDWKFHPSLNIALGATPGVLILEVPMRWADSDAGSSVPLFKYGFSLVGMLVGVWFRRLFSRGIWGERPTQVSGDKTTHEVLSLQDFLESHAGHNYG